MTAGASSVRVAAYAKVNLFLRVLAREEDGYHGIETLFCRVDLCDQVEARREKAPGVTLEVDGPDLGPVEENLAVRAAAMVLQATGHSFGVALRLQKRIPVRAGLGGGSSDAAAALWAVNELANRAVPQHELLQFAARLGSDVPFFASGAPLALGWGHGERLLRLPPLSVAPGLVVVPRTRVSTPQAYTWVDEARATAGRRGAVAMTPDTVSNWGDIARLGGNDFESPVFARHPDLRAAYEALAATRPLLCRLSGSGSALVAIYRSDSDRDAARLMLGKKHGEVLAVRAGGG